MSVIHQQLFVPRSPQPASFRRKRSGGGPARVRERDTMKTQGSEERKSSKTNRRFIFPAPSQASAMPMGPF